MKIFEIKLLKNLIESLVGCGAFECTITGYDKDTEIISYVKHEAITENGILTIKTMNEKVKFSEVFNSSDSRRALECACIGNLQYKLVNQFNTSNVYLAVNKRTGQIATQIDVEVDGTINYVEDDKPKKANVISFVLHYDIPEK